MTHLTKAAHDRAHPPTPCWSVLEARVPPGGRRLIGRECAHLAEYGLEADRHWLLTPSDANGATAHLWQPVSERYIRLDVQLIPL